MKNQESNNWLAPFREKENYTQEALAKEFNRDVKTIRRWENYETGMSNIPFDKLAKVLNTAVQRLKDAHQKGLEKHKIQKAMKKPINKRLIEQALKDCQAMGLTEKFLIKLNVNNINDATDKIAGWILDGKIDFLTRDFNQLIKTAVKSVDSGQEEDLGFIDQIAGHIALAATIPFETEKINKSQEFNIYGVKQAWAIRLAIDASIHFTMTGISAAKDTELKVAGGIKIQETN